jgi:hypothetical protein
VGVGPFGGDVELVAGLTATKLVGGVGILFMALNGIGGVGMSWGSIARSHSP